MFAIVGIAGISQNHIKQLNLISCCWFWPEVVAPFAGFGHKRGHVVKPVCVGGVGGQWKGLV